MACCRILLLVKTIESAASRKFIIVNNEIECKYILNCIGMFRKVYYSGARIRQKERPTLNYDYGSSPGG